VLARWWNDNSYGVQVYVGQGLYRVSGDSNTDAWRDPEETPGQLDMIRSLPNIQGICFFSSKSLISNPLGVSDILREHYFTQPALVPEMPWLDNTALKAPDLSKLKRTKSGIMVEWQGNRGDDYYVVYRFRGRKAGDLNDPSNIVSIQRKTSTFFHDQQVRRLRKYTYVVSSLDRLFNESEASVAITSHWKRVSKR
jgi:hypothetical protein